MKILEGSEKLEAIKFLQKTKEVAKNSTCLRSKCGAIIVNEGKIIGKGFNSPPGNLESQRRCSKKKKDYDIKITDKTCCIHAEQRAVTDALKNNSDKIEDSRLYFIRLDEKNEMLFAGKPYCTICSKFVLDVGIKEFVLWHEEGVTVYDAEEYNDLSFRYFEENKIL